MVNENLVSITDAAKYLGINRSKLNQIINKANLSKKKVGKVCLVNLHEVQNLVQQMAAKGHIRTPKSSSRVEKQDEYLINHLNDEIKRLSSERNELHEKNNALTSEVIELRGEVKRLVAPKPETTKTHDIKPTQKLSIFDKGKLISQILLRSP